jgi:DNA-binding transcriptional regulator YiaG
MAKAKKKKAAPVEKMRFPETAAPMSGDDFRIALDKLGIGQSAFARLIGVGDRTVRSYIADVNPVPMAIGYLVRLMIKTGTKPEDLKV